VVQVIENVDCDNAPKKRVLRDLAVALAEGDPDGIIVELADDVIWDVVGLDEIHGVTESRC
jgi:hypothetical protein